MQTEIKEPEDEQGPPQRAPGYDDTNPRDPGNDPAIDDPDPGSAPVTDPETEGDMGKPDDDADEEEQEDLNFSVGG